MVRHLVVSLALATALVAGTAIASSSHHVNTTFQAVGGSGVTGRVELTALPKGGTLITVVAAGLRPGAEYLSLYYGNGNCEIEPYSADDVIGRYTASSDGTASVTSKLDDDLDEIHSVSVRLASDFSLQACAPVNQ